MLNRTVDNYEHCSSNMPKNHQPVAILLKTGMLLTLFNNVISLVTPDSYSTILNGCCSTSSEALSQLNKGFLKNKAFSSLVGPWL
jgi:hypothetical protein